MLRLPLSSSKLIMSGNVCRTENECLREDGSLNETVPTNCGCWNTMTFWQRIFLNICITLQFVRGLFDIFTYLFILRRLERGIKPIFNHHDGWLLFGLSGIRTCVHLHGSPELYLVIRPPTFRQFRGRRISLCMQITGIETLLPLNQRFYYQICPTQSPHQRHAPRHAESSLAEINKINKLN